MIEKLIARMIVDEKKFAKFKKNMTKLSKQMKKQKKKLNFNSNNDIFIDIFDLFQRSNKR